MLFVVFFLIIFLCWKSIKRYKKLFNPFTLSIPYPLLFIVVPQTILILLNNGEDSYFSDVVIFLFVFALYIGTYLRLPLLKIPTFKNLKVIILFTSALLVVLLIPLVYQLLNYGLSFRGLREFYEYIVFSPYASFYEIAKTLLLLLVVILFTKKRKVTKSVFILSVLLCFSGSKMAVLSAVIVLTTLWEEYRKMNYKYLFAIFPLIFILLVGYHFSQSLHMADRSLFETALSYFDIYRQQSLALEMLIEGKIDYFYGEISMSSWYRIIPRFFWEGKPSNFGFALLNYKIYPEYSAAGYMPSFGLAYTFADFGFISIVISGLVSGFLKNYFYDIFYTSSKNVVTCILYLFEINIVIVIILTIYCLISLLPQNK